MRDDELARPVDPVSVTAPTRSRRRTLVVLVLLLAGVVAALGVAFATFRSTSQAGACSPPTQQDMQVQEPFLRSHVSDARNPKWDVADCDDNGDAYLGFDTALTPAAARDSFLADPSCSPSREQGAGADDVTCTSSGATVELFFEATSGARTAGQLAL